MSSTFEDRAKALLPRVVWKFLRYQVVGRMRWLADRIRRLMLRRAAVRVQRHLVERRRQTNKVFYPNDRDGTRWFSRLMYAEGEAGFCAQYYKRKWMVRNDHYPFMDYPAAEVLRVRRHIGRAEVEMPGPGLLPVSAAPPGEQSSVLGGTAGGRDREGREKPLHVTLDGTTRTLSEFHPERFHWLKIPGAGTVEIEQGGSELFVGSPAVHDGRRRAPRVVLTLFIDGFSSLFFDYEPFEELMPETHRFFSEGTVFERCHAIGEWTLPSMASIFTGRHTRRHGMFHPHSGPLLRPEQRLLSEYFQGAGYFTGQVGGNWRKNPALGYARGFDRTLYQRDISVSEVASEYLDHLEGFGHMDHFTWLTLHDLHHRFYGPPTVDVQSRIDLEHCYTEPSDEKSVRVEYDRNTVQRTLPELRRIDRWLGRIYRHLLDRYGEEEILVALVADHGQSYLAEDTHILSDKRIRVPFMLRGRDVPRQRSGEWVQNTDILPALHHLAGLEEPLQEIDGRLPAALGGEGERNHVFAESLYPGQTYKAVFKGAEGRLHFESEEKVDDDGYVDADSLRCTRRPAGDLLAGRGTSWYRERLERYLTETPTA